MAVAMCTPPPPVCGAIDSDRFYKFGTPSPPSVPEYSPSCYSELEENSFHSDEDIQKVRLSLKFLFVARSRRKLEIHGVLLCKLSHAWLDSTVAPFL